MSTAGHADIFAPPAAAADGRIELIGLDREELAAELARAGEPPFRARQPSSAPRHSARASSGTGSIIAAPPISPG
jgi:23S rRNA (adenine2503-C2)-methyltransferase